MPYKSKKKQKEYLQQWREKNRHYMHVWNKLNPNYYRGRFQAPRKLGETVLVPATQFRSYR